MKLSSLSNIIHSRTTEGPPVSFVPLVPSSRQSCLLAAHDDASDHLWMQQGLQYRLLANMCTGSRAPIGWQVILRHILVLGTQ
jgi:hypothetical protein